MKEPEIKIPADLHTALRAAPNSEVLWKDLTPIGRRDFVAWIESAKQPATRKRRIESMASRLASGKRRPCCFALVPMHFYKALGANSKAKTLWKDLTPNEKRDFVSWIDAAKNPAMRGIRIEEVCVLLAQGKRHA